MQSTPDELPDRITRGEEAAFEEFSRRYGRRIYCHLRRHGVHDAAARDLACNCITDIALKLRTHYTPGTHFNAWVFAVVRNVALGWLRQQRRSDTIPLPSDLTSPACFPADDARLPDSPRDKGRLAGALASLDPTDREILRLRYRGLETPSFPAIAAELTRQQGREFREATVRQRHGRALQRLEALLAGPPQEERNR